MKFEAIMFDLFGTLVDDFVSSVGQMNTELATALGAPLEPFICMRAAGASPGLC